MPNQKIKKNSNSNPEFECRNYFVSKHTVTAFGKQNTKHTKE